MRRIYRNAASPGRNAFAGFRGRPGHVAYWPRRVWNLLADIARARLCNAAAPGHCYLLSFRGFPSHVAMIQSMLAQLT